MNTAIQTFRPHSSWITAGLISLFVIAFGLFAEAHARPDNMQQEKMLTNAGQIVEICHTTKRKGFIRFH